MIKNIFALILSVGLIFSWGCANQGYPEGGPKDETPPRMIDSDPPLNATNFNDNKIEIVFDELIVLKDALQKVVISPPLNNLPTIRGLGNKVTVVFEEELQPATTYTIDFADAIQDNNEGNPLVGFTFSFSTGETQDSLQIAGYVLEADTHNPVSGALVLAHNNLADSAFTNMVPSRLAKTNDKGEFVIKNLAPGKYRIFALEDLNRNYRFDQPGERIAWHPDIIEPSFEWRTRVDSLFKDSVTLDTVLYRKELVYIPDSLQLFLFQEDYEQQYLDTREREERHRLDFIFNRPLKDSLKIKPVGTDSDVADWFVYERSVKHDTVMIWMSDSSFISKDSLIVEVTYQVRDSLNQYVDRIDTLKMFFRDKEIESSRRRRDKDDVEEKTIEPLSVRLPGGTLEIGADVGMTFPVPLKNMIVDSVSLYQLNDTVFQSVSFNVLQDSLRIRYYTLDHDWMPGAEYRLEIDSAAFEGIYGRVNKPLEASFKIKPEDNYGTLYVNVTNAEEKALIQVLNSKGNPVRSSNVPSNGKQAFRFLRPGDYYLRIVIDENDNGQWDTGDFSEGRQPERVYYYPDKITIRANWDQLVAWNIHQFSVLDFVNRNRIKTDKNTSTSSERR
ncbi:Ig-like domain-containing protein [Thermophagus xiamenensis]|uniref:Ig-like domain-containing protein n=1 Tax=Thermophagus xiamenensis TaxID=385682 RepID=A0A1I1YCT2_9BACT|nr:Ig-like domain-containing protein [Thermophagus xiamenensis]SFE15923.1 Ig-like domain-containing protein [Thermophagus xiamenensis]